MNNSSKIKAINKILKLIEPSLHRSIIMLCLYLFIGMLLEMFSLGVLFPFLKVLIDKDAIKLYPKLSPFFNFLGNPSQEKLIYGGIIVILIIYSFKTFFLTFMTWKQNKFTSNLALSLSKRLFHGYLNQSYAFHLQNNSALLLRNIQIEVNQFTSGIQSLINLALECTIILSATILLLFVEPFATIWIITFLSISAYIFNFAVKEKMLEWGKERQFTIGKSNKVLIEGLGSIKDIIMLNSKIYFSKKFIKYFQRHVYINAKVGAMNAAPRFYLEYLSVLGLIILILYTTLNHQDPQKLVPILGMFLVTAFRLMPSFNRIMSAVQSIKFSEPVVDLLYNELKINENNFICESNTESKLEFNNLQINNLNFSHQGTENSIINNINLSINRGETIGFIGPSGSGKSTLIDLFLGLLKPTSGEIKINDTDITNLDSQWKRIIGYVPQSIFLLDDSIKNNIAFGVPFDKIDEKALEKSIDDAQLLEFINSLESGINTEVGERGVRLSGGQRQRIGIARALYNNPQILILDEATSALDFETEKLIMKSIYTLKKNKTILIIAHRLTTLEFCDIIYDLNYGSIKNNFKPNQIKKLN